VPAHAESLHEALSAILLVQIALHMENMNAGLSIGRLDAWLQPYFLNDIAKAKSEEEREGVVRRAIELVGSFFLQCNDHLPLVPSAGLRLFAGSSSDMVVTIGGVDREVREPVRHDVHHPRCGGDADAARPQLERASTRKRTRLVPHGCAK
jgi:formate C-acetyltransferase